MNVQASRASQTPRLPAPVRQAAPAAASPQDVGVTRGSGWAEALDLISGLEPTSTTDLGKLSQNLARSQNGEGGWADLDTSVLNHLALTVFLRRVAHAQDYKKHYTPTNLVRFQPDESTFKSAQAALAKSWTHLTGKQPPAGEKLLGPLPRKVLNKIAAGPAELHESLLGDSLRVRLAPDQSLQNALDGVHDLEAPVKGPSSKLGLALLGAAGVAGVTAVTLGATAALASAAAGFATSWLVNSMVESIFHDKVGHSHDLNKDEPKSLIGKIYQKGPQWLKTPTFNLWFGHTKIHHFRTFTADHITQHRSPEDKAKLDKYLIKEGQSDLIDAEYGVTMNWKSFMKYQATAFPAYAVALGVACLAGAGLPFALGFVGPALAFPSMSKIYHRYTHMPAQEAMETASYPMKLYLQSDLSRFTVRHHFVHHADPSTNFNLMPGADVLRGTSRHPGVAQEEEMRRLKLLF